MLAVVGLLFRGLELLLGLPLRLARTLLYMLAAKPNLGPFRHVVSAAALYVIAAFVLVYGFAPLRGWVGHYFLADKLRYDAERWLATAIYDFERGFHRRFRSPAR